MSTDLSSPQQKSPGPPAPFWRRVNWGFAIRVPTAVATTAGIVAWLAGNVSAPVLVTAGAVAAAFPFLRSPRKIFRAIGAWDVRRRHRHVDQEKARRMYPHYPELWDQRVLLGISLEDLSARLCISLRDVRHLARDRLTVPHKEVLENFCRIVLVPFEFLGRQCDYGDELVERRLFVFWQMGLAEGWTWTAIVAADAATRRALLAVIEKQLREDLNLPEPGGSDA